MHRRCCVRLVLSVAFLASVCGCQRGRVFVADVVARQGAHWHAQRGRADQWTFAGLDPGVPPHTRPGSYASATDGVRFLDPTALGSHGYRFDWSERSGIVYTCRAGHIDIAHLRKAADWTGYLAAVTLACLETDQTRFRFKQTEPSLYFVTLTLPAHWSSLDQAERERIARIVARELGRHLAYTALTWHEIVTWFGYRPRPYKSEFPSAFSWEDTYSNLLGVHIAAAALEQQERAFSAAVTLGLRQRLEELDAQPARAAEQAAKAVQGRWYSRKGVLTTIYKRNLDIGLDDGFVTPCLLPSVPVCAGVQPLLLAVPTLDALTAHGFSARVEIEPRVWEERRILEALDPSDRPSTGRFDPAVHFPLLMSFIERDATRLQPVDPRPLRGCTCTEDRRKRQ